MKTVYIPKGETVHYESLATEHLVVHGRLRVNVDAMAERVDHLCLICHMRQHAQFDL